jgi:uncharacterized membrane protein
MWEVAVPDQLMNSAWLIKKISVERVVKFNHIYCSNKMKLCAKGNNVDNTSEVLNARDE